MFGDRDFNTVRSSYITWNIKRIRKQCELPGRMRRRSVERNLFEWSIWGDKRHLHS